MKRFLIIIFVSFLSISCNQDKIRDLENTVRMLRNDNEDLASQNENLERKIYELNEYKDLYSYCQQNLEITERNYNGYKYGKNICITRGYTTVCGAEKIIDWLGDHYCQ